MFLLVNASAIIFLLLDVFFHGDLVITSGFSFSANVLSKVSLLYIAVIYIALNLRNVKVILLSPITLFPLFCFNRELLEIKTYSITLSIFDMYLFLILFYVGAYKGVSSHFSFLGNKMLGPVVILLCAGSLQVIYHNTAINLNGFFITYLYPLIYFLFLSSMNLSIVDIRRSIFTMFLISLFVFCLQNVYIGPLVVYRSSIEQTWLTQNISIANGGLLEIGAMEVFLMPIAFYIIWHYRTLQHLYSKNHFRILTVGAAFVCLMPFIYHNRANSLVVLCFFAFFGIKRLSLGKLILSFSFVIPIFSYFTYKMVVSRSLVSDGKSIDLLGIPISGIDSTTFDHLHSTVLGFEYLQNNFIFGLGMLTGADSYRGALFYIGNMRNFLFPSIEVAVSMGGLFYLLYFILVFTVYRLTKDLLMKFILLLQFIPVVGAGRFFSPYSTGNLSLNTGFSSLSDNVPIAIYSILTVYVYLLCISSPPVENAK